jgi:hypothetical protein
MNLCALCVPDSYRDFVFFVLLTTFDTLFLFICGYSENIIIRPLFPIWSSDFVFPSHFIRVGGAISYAFIHFRVLFTSLVKSATTGIFIMFSENATILIPYPCCLLHS